MRFTYLEKEEIFDPGATVATRTIEYIYDEVGNRLSRVDSGEGTTIYTYDNNDRLSTETTEGVATNYTYDNNGNTISKTTGDDTVTYEWDAENRLVAGVLFTLAVAGEGLFSKSDAPTDINIQKIIKAVSENEEFNRRISGYGGSFFSSALGSNAGTARNAIVSDFGFRFRSNADADSFLCFGVAQSAANAINSQKLKLEVLLSYDIERWRPVYPTNELAYHVATYVKFRNGNELIFDWHATLDPNNPDIYNNITDFALGNPR